MYRTFFWFQGQMFLPVGWYDATSCLVPKEDMSQMGEYGTLPPTVDRQTCVKHYLPSGGSRIFPRGGREPSRGGVNTPNFPENCMKSKEFGRPGGGRASLTPPPRSANASLNFICGRQRYHKTNLSPGRVQSHWLCNYTGRRSYTP